MPRSGGVYSAPAGTKATPNTTIQSAPYNAFVDDLTNDANAPRPVSAGGTGATNVTAARDNLGIAIGVNVQRYYDILQSIALLTTSANQVLMFTGPDAAGLKPIGTSGDAIPLLNGNNIWTGSAEYRGNLSSTSTTTNGRLRLASPAAEANLDADFGTNSFRVRNASNQTMLTLDLATGDLAPFAPISIFNGGTGANTVAGARAALNLGSLATLNSVNNANWSGADLAVENGGTGASNAAAARNNLGLGSAATQNTGTSGANVPLLNGNNVWSGTAEFQGNLISSSAGSNGRLQLVSASADARIDADSATNTLRVRNAANSTLLTLDLPTGNLSLAGSLNVASGGTGATTAAAARTNLGLGSIATLNAINNANWSGTALAIANGGTGATTVAGARTALNLGNLATLNTSDLVYSGSNSQNVNFPVGTTLMVTRSGAPQLNRNSTGAVYVRTSDTLYFSRSSVDATQLSGTWVSRGNFGEDWLLMQRIA